MAGRVLAVVAGPPCATWSAARFLELPEGGPRPVRTCEQPWGIDNLVTKERKAVELGSQLLRAAIELLYAAAAVGCVFVLEHPAEPQQPLHCPSIWKLPQLKHAFATLGVQRVRIDQCALGAPSKKPTELAVAHAPCLAEQANTIRCPGRGHKHIVLGGKTMMAAGRQQPPKSILQRCVLG